MHVFIAIFLIIGKDGKLVIDYLATNVRGWTLLTNKLGQALWARSKFGLWYAAIGVVKMLHTDNKVNTESL